FIGVLGNESAMRLHSGNSGLLGEIRHLLDARDTGVAILARRHPDGQWSFVKIVNLGPGTSGDRGSHLYVVFRQRIPELGGDCVIQRTESQLASGESKIVNALDGRLGV